MATTRRACSLSGVRGLAARRRRGEDHFGGRIVRQLWCSGHDHECPLPWSLAGNKGELLLHPPRDERWIGLACGDPGGISSLDRIEVRLHPYGGVKQMRDLAPACPDTLDDDQAGVGR